MRVTSEFADGITTGYINSPPFPRARARAAMRPTDRAEATPRREGRWEPEGAATRGARREGARADSVAVHPEHRSRTRTASELRSSRGPAQQLRGRRNEVPMLCASEIDVPDAQPRCLRVLLHVDRRASQPPLIPIYLRDAASLRPDLSLASPREPAHESRHEARHDPVPALAGAEQA